MDPIKVILIFDVGKTNKKLLLFDEHYRIVFENSTQLDETIDEDGDACEDIVTLSNWLQESFLEITADERYLISAVSVSAYGATLVHLDEYTG